MVESIYKFSPHRTISLRGTDSTGAAAFLAEATATSLKWYGVFRAMQDFSVMYLSDRDDFYESFRLKYLPNGNMAGIVLEYDFAVDGVQGLDSVFAEFIPYRSLSYILETGEPGTIDLWPLATLVGGTFPVATGSISIVTGGAAAGDVVSIWLDNQPFPYVAGGGESAATIAAALAQQINVLDWRTPAPAEAVIATSSGGAIQLQAARYGSVNTSGTTVTWTAFDPFPGIAPGSVIWINGVSKVVDSITSPTELELTTSAGVQAGVAYLAERGGRDGNTIVLYTLSNGGSTTWSAPTVQLSGGDSYLATWRVSIDFTALGLDSLRQCWLTMAPAIANGAAYTDTEWTATFTNMTVVADPNSNAQLYASDPYKSVRTGNQDALAVYAGAGWLVQDSINYWHGFGHVIDGTLAGPLVTVEINCQYTHDLWMGTSLYVDRGIVSVTVDGGAPFLVDCFCNAEPPIQTRVLLAAGVAAGLHTVVIEMTGTKHAMSAPWDIDSTGYFFVFDYLEASIAADIQDPEVTYTTVSPATDFDTDTTYKVPPQRLMWGMDRLGFTGFQNHYVGVFFWNERRVVGQMFTAWVVTIGGTWVAGDQATLHISSFNVQKTVVAEDTNQSIADSFVYYINQTASGVWAEITGAAEITIRERSPLFTDMVSTSKTSALGTISESGNLDPGVEGVWVIDNAAPNAINFPTRKWHEDFFSEVALRGQLVAVAFSMELVNPDESSGEVFDARFADGTAVETATGLGSLLSTHCAFTPDMAALHLAAFTFMAQAMDAAGLVPWCQFGEFLWWFFSSLRTNYDTGVLIPLAVTPSGLGEIYFSQPHGMLTGGWAINAGYTNVDGSESSLNGTWQITVVNPNQLSFDGSVANGVWDGASGITALGSMGYYDAYTTAQALIALGHPLGLFNCQDQPPMSVSAGADAAYLAAVLFSYVDNLATALAAAVPGTMFEVLYPFDVNNPICYYTQILPFPQGGALNYTVNTPPQWLTKAGSGFDRLKVEALSWGSFYRNFDYIEEAVSFATVIANWALADTAYLMPIFNGGCPWPTENFTAEDIATPNIIWFAHDHVCLMSWPVPVKRPRRGGALLP